MRNRTHTHTAHPGEGRDPGQVTPLFAASSRHGAAATYVGSASSDLSWVPAFAGMNGGCVTLLQNNKV